MAGTIQCGRRSPQGLRQDPVDRRDPEPHRGPEALLRDVPAEGRRARAPGGDGLQAVFKSVFPIADYNDNALLEFDSYHFGDPKYTVEECHDRGMTFAIPLKVTLRLVVFDHDKEAKTKTIREQRGQEVYLGELPLMTDKGTFIINGTERVVVEPAPALGRRVLRRRQGQDARLRQAALLGARHPVSRLVGGVRLRRQRHPARARGPAAQDARHRAFCAPSGSWRRASSSPTRRSSPSSTTPRTS